MPAAGMQISPQHYFSDIATFTPLESPSIYAEDSRNRKHQLLLEGEVKASPFLTGFTAFL